MRTEGKHIIVEISGCNSNILNDLNKVKEILRRAALKANAEILELAFHHFTPQGVSGVVVISESHLSVHTWPEYGYAALDIYTCGEKTEPFEACKYAAEEFGAKTIFKTVISRGEEKDNKFFHHIEEQEKETVVGEKLAMVS